MSIKPFFLPLYYYERWLYQFVFNMCFFFISSTLLQTLRYSRSQSDRYLAGE